jgi:hypothetical protein
MANYFTVEDLAFQVFDSRDRTLLQAGTVGSVGPVCTLGGIALATCRVADCNSVKNLGFQLLSREDGTSYRHARWEVLGFCAPGRAGHLVPLTKKQVTVL